MKTSLLPILQREMIGDNSVLKKMTDEWNARPEQKLSQALSEIQRLKIKTAVKDQRIKELEELVECAKLLVDSFGHDWSKSANVFYPLHKSYKEKYK